MDIGLAYFLFSYNGCPCNSSKKNSFPHVIGLKNKPFFTETLKVGKAVVEAPKWISAKPIFGFLTMGVHVIFSTGVHVICH